MNKECCICLENKEFYNIECNHIICKDCVVKIEKPECPLCRSNLDSLPYKIYIKINNRRDGSLPQQVLYGDNTYSNSRPRRGRSLYSA